MLCRKFKQIFTKSAWNKLDYYTLSTRLSKKCVLLDSLLKIYKVDRSMSSFRLIVKDLRLWSVWTRSYIISTVVKRYRKEGSVRDVILRFRQSLLRPRQTLLLSATAAYKSNGDSEYDEPPKCEKNITDEELEDLANELEGVELLSKSTLFCTSCGRRLVIDRKHAGVRYCICKEPSLSECSDNAGWIPYMEAEDVIVWRKELNPGQGHYAYKVYGQYKEVKAEDFAAVQVDGEYRRVWDAAVAALSVVEQQANGINDQTILHWEVLWPRLFANRDYVYIRRHKELEVTSGTLSPHKQKIFDVPPERKPSPYIDTQRPSVHSKAKRKALEAAERSKEDKEKTNKVYIIASKSCEHASVPETKHAIRVSRFWSHMVIKTIDGTDKPGMEFVLTYYDEPAVGGLPCGVATWATGRAAPAFLDRMRRAATDYRAWRAGRSDQNLTFRTLCSVRGRSKTSLKKKGLEEEGSLPATTDAAKRSKRQHQLEHTPFRPEKASQEFAPKKSQTTISEQDMESSKQGPDLDNDDVTTEERSTQTELERSTVISTLARVEAQNTTMVQNKHTEKQTNDKDAPVSGDSDKPEEDTKQNSGSWWRYLYPFYYFV